MTQLHVYTNDTEWYAARDLDDAYLAMEEHNGTKRADVDSFNELYQVRDAEMFGISIVPGQNTSDLTAAEWAKLEGRGFLCTVDL